MIWSYKCGPRLLRASLLLEPLATSARGMCMVHGDTGGGSTAADVAKVSAAGRVPPSEECKPVADLVLSGP